MRSKTVSHAGISPGSMALTLQKRNQSALSVNIKKILPSTLPKITSFAITAKKRGPFQPDRGIRRNRPVGGVKNSQPPRRDQL